MLYRYLESECAQLLSARRTAVQMLQTPEAVRGRQEELRAKFLAAIGPFPQKTPLNARTISTMARDGYRVENVVYESRPNHHVPGNLYVPEGKGPFPGILFPLGHYSWPRAAEEYQRTCILLAKYGFVVLTYDPPGQGERHQLVASGRGPDAHGTTEHTLIDCGARLVGSSAAMVFVWDAMRGLDYLASRPEVDPKRLGCTGNSGGGTTTALLMAADDRVGCAVPNCFITTWEKLYSTVGPQDGEANIPGQVAMGFNHADFALLRAPKPTQLSCPNRDYYDIGGAWDTFKESKRLYGVLGHAERMDFFEWDDKHSISRPGREAMLRWMRRWLMNIDDAAVETDFPVEKEEDLHVTKCGHVILEFKGRTLYDFTADRVKELTAKRRPLPKEDLLREVRRMIALGSVEAARGRPGSPPVFLTDPGIQIPVVSLNASPEKPKLLFVSGDGNAKSAAAIEKWAQAGFAVTAIDLRGMGDTEPVAPHKGLSRNFIADWKEVYLSLALNRPLLGQRVGDLLAVRAAIDPEGRGVHLVGVGAAAPVVLHAAALEPRFTNVTLDAMVTSWTDVALTPLAKNQLTNVIPGALNVYDLPDLAGAIAPRPLSIRRSADPTGSPVSQKTIDETYAATRAAYAGQNAAERLMLRAEE
jgi:cephalosporin-C deacetylase-like acetyl esterase